MSNEVKAVAVVGVLVALLIGAATYFSLKSGPGGPSGAVPAADASLADAGQLVRPDSHTQGVQNARVTVVEFADFQCPACKYAYPQIKQLEQEYQGKSVQFVFRNFPLPSHRNTMVAHNAAEEAGKQGKYWEMHDRLYVNQDEWSADGPTPKSLAQAEDIIVGYARDLGLNADKVRQAIDGNAYSSVFSRDLADGEKLGVNATPTVFVNGKKLKYVSEVKGAIDSALGDTAQKPN